MKSKAPSLVASTAVLTLPWPERITTSGRSALGPEALQHVEAVHLRHLDVEEDEVGRFLLGDLEPRGAVGREQALVALVLEDHLQRRADGLLVVDDEDPRLHGWGAATSIRAR